MNVGHKLLASSLPYVEYVYPSGEPLYCSLVHPSWFFHVKKRRDGGQTIVPQREDHNISTRRKAGNTIS